ncbi:MAG: site-2 protease family protein [Clostridia bacterium]|jgi:Zn-dependent protease|nr:site-2 protease family protein [Clostridia bacterium]
MLDILLSDMSGIQILIYLLSFLLAILFALSLHEYAHAYIAVKQGDITPKALGRLSLNPLRHIDPLGFLFLMLFGFGWAKPVPINPTKFKNFRKGLFLTSIAGVTMNLILAIFSMGFLVLTNKYFNNNNNASLFLLIFFLQFTYINIGLAIFNLLPIYPLDGFNMLVSCLKFNSPFLNFMRKYGTYILLGLMISGLLSIGISYVIDFIANPLEMFWNWVFSI